MKDNKVIVIGMDGIVRGVVTSIPQKTSNIVLRLTDKAEYEETAPPSGKLYP